MVEQTVIDCHLLSFQQQRIITGEKGSNKERKIIITTGNASTKRKKV